MAMQPQYDWTRIQTLKRRLEYAENRNISWDEIAEGIGISTAALKKIAYGDTKSPLSQTIGAVINFFNNTLKKAGDLEGSERITLLYFEVLSEEDLTNKQWATPNLEAARSVL